MGWAPLRVNRTSTGRSDRKPSRRIAIPGGLHMGYGQGSMSETAGHELRHLSPATAGLGRVFARPKVMAGLCVIILACLGWVYLALLSASGTTGSLGRFGFVQALCSTLLEGSAGPYAAAVIFSMWCAMTLAMMLPSAAPMILT